VMDALRFKFKGKPRTFQPEEPYATKIADSAVERAKQEQATPWPVEGGQHSFDQQIRRLIETDDGTAAPVLDLLLAQTATGNGRPNRTVALHPALQPEPPGAVERVSAVVAAAREVVDVKLPADRVQDIAGATVVATQGSTHQRHADKR
jgi:hypothetical protein